jgi:hypothetical protein
MGNVRRVPLRHDALIVRFGLMNVSDIKASIRRCKAMRGFHGLSFFGENDLTLEEIAETAGAPHRWLRVARYGALTAAGHRLKRQGPANHLVLVFRGTPSDDELRRLVEVFDAPQENPHPV